MIGESPFRSLTSSSWTEEELWLRLDCALEEAMVDPAFAWSLAWTVWIDSKGHNVVRVAADSLLDELGRQLR